MFQTVLVIMVMHDIQVDSQETIGNDKVSIVVPDPLDQKN